MEKDYIPFRERFLKCKWTGVLQLGKCEHCGSTLLQCTRYGGLCSSKNCKEGKIKEHWRKINELEEEIGRTLDKLSKTKFIGLDGLPTKEYMILWKKHKLLKDISTKMQVQTKEWGM
jgi:transcription initiation factor IIE alpha subunit